jgi:hypothetical protein
LIGKRSQQARKAIGSEPFKVTWCYPTSVLTQWIDKKRDNRIKTKDKNLKTRTLKGIKAFDSIANQKTKK